MQQMRERRTGLHVPEGQEHENNSLPLSPQVLSRLITPPALPSTSLPACEQ